MDINLSTIFLSLLADQSGDRSNLYGVSVKAGVACATDGMLLGTIRETGGFEGFLPLNACKAVLKGAKKDSTFEIDGEYLTRNDGVAFKITEDPDRADFPDYSWALRDESTFELDESIKLDLSLLVRFETFLRRAGLETGAEFSFNDNMSAVVIMSGDFTGIIMPQLKERG